MYINRIKTHKSQPYYYLRDSDNTVLVSLGHTRNPERAYAEALRDYLKAAARLQAFERVMPMITGKAAQRG